MTGSTGSGQHDARPSADLVAAYHRLFQVVWNETGTVEIDVPGHNGLSYEDTIAIEEACVAIELLLTGDGTPAGDTRHPLDRPAAAAYGAFCASSSDRLGPMPPWDQIPDDARADWRAVADVVLMIKEITPMTEIPGRSQP